MAVFGKNGFIRKQETVFARKLLVWKYENSGMALPDDSILSAQAQKVVEDAHLIAKKSGRDVLEILKDTIQNIKKKVTDDF